MSEILIIENETIMETNAATLRAVYDSSHVHSKSDKCLKNREGPVPCTEAVDFK
jgi:hypothetical protein